MHDGLHTICGASETQSHATLHGHTGMLPSTHTHAHIPTRTGPSRHTIGYLTISVEAAREHPLKCDPQPLQEQPLALIG